MFLLGRTTPRAVPWAPGWAVRRDCPDGSHEFVGFRLTEADAGWFAVGDRQYWLRGPVRPVHSIVQVSTRDFELHVGRRQCRVPDCPQVVPSAVGWPR